ncbi:hypothetical protein [Falsiroseomonas sp.]|uniref:hypothetical protein n=1 Tax=Falsiroseomonas sp. TaxID=2870721 RepID=UPI0034A11CFB
MQTHVATAGQAGYGRAAPEGAPALPPRISWGAILAGGLFAVAVGAMLNVLGLAVGATTIDPAQPGETPGAGLLGIASGIWLLVANLIGLTAGGWVAARLSGTADDTDGVLHGLSVWAISFLVSAVLLGNILSGTASTAMTGASAILGGTAQGAGEAAGQAARAMAPQLAGTIDAQQLADRLRNGLETGGDPARMSTDQRRAEIARLLGQRLRQGDFLPGQRDRLAQIVGAEYGLPPAEAQSRISRLEAEARQVAAQAETEARAAAQATAEATATGAYWIFAALLLGAVAAVLGARLGTRRIAGTQQLAAQI